MSAGIVARFPWQALYLPGLDEQPFAVVISDTRVSASCGGTPYKQLAPKQFRLAKNLMACFTSSNLTATADALLLKGRDRSNKKTGLATPRDLSRLGSMLRASHLKYGGHSEIVATIWPRGASGPTVVELMPPSYQAREVDGIVGIGSRDVLARFSELYRERPLANLQYAGIVETAAASLGAAFSQAVEEVGSPSVALPLQVTTVHRHDILARRMDLVRSGTKSVEPLTAAVDSLALPSNRVRVDQYVGGRLRAERLMKGIGVPEAELRIALHYGEHHALAFAAILDKDALYYGTGRLSSAYGFYNVRHRDGGTDVYGLGGFHAFQGSSPLDSITGAERVEQARPNVRMLDLTYVPIPDSQNRRTLTLDLDPVNPPNVFDLWLGESGKDDFPSTVLGSYAVGVEVLGSVIAAWARPQMAIVVARDSRIDNLKLTT